MNTTLPAIASSPFSKPAPACCSAAAKPSPLEAKLDTICRIALGVFAALCAPITFAITFGAGLIAGAVYAFTKISQNQPMYPDGQNKPVCAQGYMEFLSGMKFPPAVATVATAAFIAAHTRHDPLFYVPFCGLFLGFWLGRQSVILSQSSFNAH
jgi:hypothetical protein